MVNVLLFAIIFCFYMGKTWPKLSLFIEFFPMFPKYEFEPLWFARGRHIGILKKL